jgi:hypothetical protein
MSMNGGATQQKHSSTSHHFHQLLVSFPDIPDPLPLG